MYFMVSYKFAYILGFLCFLPSDATEIPSGDPYLGKAPLRAQ